MRQKKANTAPERHYTFKVSFSFDMQYTFTEDEVQAAEEGGEGDVAPTDEALLALKNEIEDYLSKQYPADNMEAVTDFLIGIVEE